MLVRQIRHGKGALLTISNGYGCKGSGSKVGRCESILEGVIVLPIYSFLHSMRKWLRFQSRIVQEFYLRV